MTQNASGLFPFTLASAARGGIALFIQVMIGMVLLAAAGMFASNRRLSQSLLTQQGFCLPERFRHGLSMSLTGLRSRKRLRQRP